MELSNIMSTSHIESLMLNRATVDGWTILDKDGKKHRVIGIGNQKNCNGDELWSYQMELSGNAPPTIFELNGSKYISVIATGGYNFKFPDRGSILYTFKIQ